MKNILDFFDVPPVRVRGWARGGRFVEARAHFALSTPPAWSLKQKSNSKVARIDLAPQKVGCAPEMTDDLLITSEFETWSWGVWTRLKRSKKVDLAGVQRTFDVCQERDKLDEPAAQISGILPGRYDKTVSTDEFKTEAQQNRQKEQHLANELAHTQAQPLPFPSIWDDLDPTKLAKSATPEEITQRYQDFCAICPPPPRKEYTI